MKRSLSLSGGWGRCCRPVMASWKTVHRAAMLYHVAGRGGPHKAGLQGRRTLLTKHRFRESRANTPLRPARLARHLSLQNIDIIMGGRPRVLCHGLHRAVAGPGAGPGRRLRSDAGAPGDRADRGLGRHAALIQGAGRWPPADQARWAAWLLEQRVHGMKPHRSGMELFAQHGTQVMAKPFSLDTLAARVQGIISG